MKKSPLEKKQKSRTAKCSVCGKVLDIRGVNGHLRFVHGLGTVVKDGKTSSVVMSIKPSEEIRMMMTELANIRERKIELNKQIKSSGLFGSTMPEKELLKVLDAQESKLVSRAKKLQKEILRKRS